MAPIRRAKGAPPPQFSVARLGERWAVAAGPAHLGVNLALFDAREDAEAAMLDLEVTLRWHLMQARQAPARPAPAAGGATR